MNFSRFFLFIMSILLASSISQAETQFSVGVSPLVVDIGEVERGSSTASSFFIVTPSDDPLLVSLEPEPGSIDFFKNSYAKLVNEYSEEKADSWVYFFSNPIDLKPGIESIKTTAGNIKGWREISFLLNVPENAEPGYHLFRIKPSPQVPSEFLGPVGARVVSLVSVSVLVKVKGEAERKGIILDVVPSASDKYVEMSNHFKNTGTVTFLAKVTNIIYDSSGSNIGEFISPPQTVGPGSTAIFKTYVPSKYISTKEFDVSTIVDYHTGSTQRNMSLNIPEQAVQVPFQPKAESSVELIYVVIIIIIIISIFIFVR